MIASAWLINDLVSIPQSHKGKNYTYYKSLKLKYKTLLFCSYDALHSNGVITHCLINLVGIDWQLLLVLIASFFIYISSPSIKGGYT